MQRSGWRGRRIVVYGPDDDGAYTALTGSHRLEAAKRAGIDAKAYVLTRAGVMALEDAGLINRQGRLIDGDPDALAVAFRRAGLAATAQFVKRDAR